MSVSNGVSRSPPTSTADRASLCQAKSTWNNGGVDRSRAGRVAPPPPARTAHVLAGQPLDRRFPNPGEQLVEPRPTGQVRPDDQGVGEEADQPLDLGPVPVGDRDPDSEVLLSGVSAENRLPPGHQHHEQRRPGPIGEGPQSGRPRSCGRATGMDAPRPDGTGGRGRSVGNSSRGAALPADGPSTPTGPGAIRRGATPAARSRSPRTGRATPGAGSAGPAANAG